MLYPVQDRNHISVRQEKGINRKRFFIQSSLSARLYQTLAAVSIMNLNV